MLVTGDWDLLELGVLEVIWLEISEKRMFGVIRVYLSFGCKMR